MDILEELYELTDEELEKYVRNRINILENEYINSNHYRDYIGYNLDINPKYPIYTNENEDYDIVEMFSSINYYIPLYTKVVYGMIAPKEYACNGGYYYYIDDDSYIIDFLKYIKNNKVINDYDLFDELLWFIDERFENINGMQRRDINKLIMENDSIFYPLNNEHYLSSFYKKGCAECSEYALLAHNILFFLGYNCMYIMGVNDNQGHAFNFVSYYDNKLETAKNVLLDFSYPVCSVYINHEVDCKNPFICELDKNIYEVISDFKNGKSVECNNYFFMYFENQMFKFSYDKKREYSLGKRK